MFVTVFDLTGNGLVDFLRFFSLENVLGEFFGLDFGTDAIPGDLVPGTYLDAERASFASPGHPGLDFFIDGVGCARQSLRPAAAGNAEDRRARTTEPRRSRRCGI
jgi:hypothetical protein